MAKPTTLFHVAVIIFVIVTAAVVLDKPGAQELQSNYATVLLYSETGNHVKIKAEISDTNEERAKGMMLRQQLDKGEGMLFFYPDSAVRNFWMKNTLIPLDMIFIAENMTVVKIHHAVPCSSEPCTLYNSEQPIKYVLEVNRNLTASHGISEGGKVKIDLT
ncbi:DUF192 domain-containing protein [Candidatus Woesearchaeota archaeon]|nr:DUF192 domain-containing protein [Candidatus Woesearchaeota archaeon]